MSVSFQRETWRDFYPDAQQIFPIHFRELSLHQDEIPAGCDSEIYETLEDKGFLLVITARDGRKLVGYYVGMVFDHHPHNKDAGRVSTTDMFYMLPEYRTGNGAKLLISAEIHLRKFGVRKAAISTKLKQDHRKLFEALGWEATDIVFHKLL